MHILVHHPALLSAKLQVMYCNTSRSRPPVRLHSLTVAQSKALEFLQKTALNIIFPGGEYATNLLNYQHQNTESRWQQLSQLFFWRSWVWGACPLRPLWIRQWLQLTTVG